MILATATTRLLTLLAICLLFAIKPSHSAASSSSSSKATVEMYLRDGINDESKSIGVITFQYNAQDKTTRVSGKLGKVEPAGQHGFHVHSMAPKVGGECKDLGSHFNPFNTTHGAQTNDDKSRHVGDLGNVKADADGNVEIDITDRIIQIGTGDAQFDVAGKAMAIHVATDDLGLGNATSSNSTGNAGYIMACGQIKIVQDNSGSSLSTTTTTTTTFTTLLAMLAFVLAML